MDNVETGAMTLCAASVLSAHAYVNTIEDPACSACSRSVGAHLGLTPRNINHARLIAAGSETVLRFLSYLSGLDPACFESGWGYDPGEGTIYTKNRRHQSIFEMLDFPI
jgi:hypothetical protein